MTLRKDLAMGWIKSSQVVRQSVPPAAASVIKAVVLAAGVTLGPILSTGLAVANNGEDSPETVSSRFTCELQDGVYTVMYRPKSEPGQAYPWAVPEEMGGGWTPELRCETISDRLEEYRPDGLVELRTDVENGYNTVCATTEENLDSCRIVFTVPVGQDPVATRDAVFSNITLADAGTNTDAVTTFVGGSGVDILGTGGLDSEIFGVASEILGGRPAQARGIYLKPYLDPSDGGTGAYLNQTDGRQLNPENFR